MAARIKKIRHDEETRMKIKVAHLINVLQNHAEGKIEVIAPTRIRAIEILLKKVLPDLSDVKVEHNVDGVTFNLNMGAPKSK